MDLKNAYVHKLQEKELDETIVDRLWYVPHHPLIKPHKPEGDSAWATLSQKQARIIDLQALDETKIAAESCMKSLPIQRAPNISDKGH